MYRITATKDVARGGHERRELFFQRVLTPLTHECVHAVYEWSFPLDFIAELMLHPSASCEMSPTHSNTNVKFFDAEKYLVGFFFLILDDSLILDASQK